MISQADAVCVICLREFVRQRHGQRTCHRRKCMRLLKRWRRIVVDLTS